MPSIFRVIWGRPNRTPQTRRTQLQLETLEERVNPNAVTFGGNYGPAAFAEEPNAIAAGDFFGNGYNDLLVGSPNLGVSIIENQGNRQFQVTGSIAMGDVRSILLSDLTGNGKLDMVVANGDAGCVSIAMGNGDGTFQPVTTINNLPGGVEDIALADLTGNGRPDLLVSVGNKLEVFLNNGTSTPFSTETTYGGTSADTYGIAVGDFAGNGRMDVAMQGYGADKVFVFMNNGDGTFQSAVGYSLPAHCGGVATGDFEGDGRDDIVVGYALASGFGILRSNPDGTFQAPITYTLPNGSNAGALAVADFGNGKLDVDVALQNTSAQAVFLGNGDGTFQTPFTVSAAYDPSHVIAADMVNDGMPDLISTQGLSPGGFQDLANTTFTITTRSLPNWDVNVASYSQTLATNGSAVGTFSVYPGDTLPTGLILSSTGVLSGTPTALGTFNFRITATDSGGDTDTQSYTVTINQTPSITTTSLSDWDQNLTGYSQTIATTGGTGPLTFSLASGSLPTGLNLNSSTGVISGTPTGTGAFSFIVQVTDSANATESQSFTVNINSPPSIVTNTLEDWDQNYGGYNQTITVNNGTGTFTFSLQPSDSLPAGLSLSTGGGITGTPTTVQTTTFHVIATDSVGGQAIEAYTVIISAPLTITNSTLADWDQNLSGYSKTVNTSGGTGLLTFSVSSGSLPGGLSLNSSSGAITGTPNTAGAFSFQIQAKDGTGATTTQNYTVLINAAPSITTTSLENWDLNFAGYSQTITAKNGTGAVTFALQSGDSLPAGLSLSTGGVITGTPTTAGSTTFHVIATDSIGGQASQVYTVTIESPPDVTPTTLRAWDVNVPGYAAVLTGGNGVGTLSLSLKIGDALPPGLVLTAATGLISGTPNSVGAYNFHIIVSDSIGDTTTQNCTITINPPLSITTTSLNNWTVNVKGYSQAVVTSGGTGPFTFSVQSGDNLPAGLSLNANTGVISGTPTTTGISTFHITATDSLNVAFTQVYTVTIAGALTLTADSFSSEAGVEFSGQVGMATDATALTKGANLTATINWGDGSVTSGTVGDDGHGNYAISGSHTYAYTGSHTVTITLGDTTNPSVNVVESASSTVSSHYAYYAYIYSYDTYYYAYYAYATGQGSYLAYVYAYDAYYLAYYAYYFSATGDTADSESYAYDAYIYDYDASYYAYNDYANSGGASVYSLYAYDYGYYGSLYSYYTYSGY